MLAKVMPVEQRLGDTGTALPQSSSVVGHAGDRFQHGRIVGRIMGVFPQQNGAWPATRTAGIASGSRP